MKKSFVVAAVVALVVAAIGVVQAQFPCEYQCIELGKALCGEGSAGAIYCGNPPRPCGCTNLPQVAAFECQNICAM